MEPTDDELLAVLRETHPEWVPQPGWMSSVDEEEQRIASCLRHYCGCETQEDTASGLRCVTRLRDVVGDGVRLARALRRRFPQPITDAVLRAAGFERNEAGDWEQTIGYERCFALDYGGGVWGVMRNNRLIGPVRTPDRLHDVVRHLRGLYTPGEDD